MLSWALLLGGATAILLAIYVVVIDHSRLPYWDGWMQIEFAANEGPGHTLDWLWRQFNQHRVVLPKLFMLADLRWFRATQVSMLVVNLCIQFAHLSLLAWSMRKFGGWRGSLWRTGVGLAAFCLFCPSQWPNLLSGFTGLCCFLPPFFMTLAAVGLLLYGERCRQSSHGGAWKYLALCIGAAICGTYSLSNGNLIWPLLLVAALVLRVPAKGTAVLVLSAIISIAAYFYNYTVYIRPATLATRTSLAALANYIAVYFGSSWVPSNPGLAEAIGFAGFVLLLLVLADVPKYYRAAPAFCVQLVITLLFALGTGIVTAPGRYVFGIDQAFSPRYQSFALLFWCSMALLLLGDISAFDGAWALVGAEAGLAIIMLVAAFHAPTPLRRARWQGFNLNAAAAALETAVPDRDQLLWAHADPTVPLSYAGFLHERKLSVFTERAADLLGMPLASEFKIADAGACRGAIESQTMLSADWPAAFRIRGWAWDVGDGGAPADILVASGGTIVGLGATGDARDDQVKRAAAATTNRIGFTAYVRDVPRSEPLQLYAVPNGSSKWACPVAVFRPS